MFARSILRSAGPLRQNIRSYATESNLGGARLPLILGAGSLVVGVTTAVGYTLYTDSRAPVASAEAATDKVKSASTEPPKTFTGGDQGFIDLKLSEVSDINHNVKRLRFELPDKDAVSGLTVASALITKYKSQDMEKPVIRPYTPISDEDDRGYLDLLIKRYPNGPMSEHMHSMTPGQRLDFKGPIPKYPWSTNKHNHIALIAGGTGITPMFQLTRRIFKDPAEKTKVTLVFANLSEEDILLKKEFEQLENEYPNRFRAFYTVDTPPKSWPYGTGHVTKELLEKAIPGPKEENVKVFVCGPPGMYKAISGMKKSPQDQGDLSGFLQELGYSKDQVYKF